MGEEREASEQEPEFTEEMLYSFILRQIKAGADRTAIVRMLIDKGMGSVEASHQVETIYPRIIDSILKQQYAHEALMPALVGGLLAACAGGVVWGLVAVTTNREIGIVAWGIGWLSGYAVVLFARGRKGLPLQVIAFVTTILGIAFGKYVIFYHHFRRTVQEEFGAEVAAELSIFSEESVRRFIDSIGSVITGYDLLWVVLAVATAWSIPRGLGIELPESGYYRLYRG
ncbi:MAG: hypothetical protein JSV44_05905 [Candidatus Zixiibacteriota bacterium]|nr:MAG: hypothetical protein JSV44_05905 [candidate division Zixibacteria bacterium]